MQKSWPIFWSALSVASLTGGLFAFCFGLLNYETLQVHGLWILNGLWTPSDYCFLGAILSTFGAGTLTASILFRLNSARTRSTYASTNFATVDFQKVMLELQALKQQTASAQSTTHEFNLALDTTLARLEQRVGNLEATHSMGTTDTYAPTIQPQQTWGDRNLLALRRTGPLEGRTVHPHEAERAPSRRPHPG